MNDRELIREIQRGKKEYLMIFTVSAAIRLGAARTQAIWHRKPSCILSALWNSSVTGT